MLQRSGWSELLRAKASVFALNEETKQWVERGSSGQLWLSQNERHPLDVRMKWWAPSRGESWWRLMSGQLKAKGERAWVLKALDLGTKSEEIVAIRFCDIPSAHNFALRLQLIFGAHSECESLGGALAADSGNGNGNGNALGHHQSAAPWECAVCTFSNDGDVAQCRICGLSAAASGVVAVATATSGDAASGSSGSDGAVSAKSPHSVSLHSWRCPVVRATTLSLCALTVRPESAAID